MPFSSYRPRLCGSARHRDNGLITSRFGNLIYLAKSNMKMRLRLFEHVLLVLALAAAIVLARMTQWAEAQELPVYLVQGMHLAGKVLFFLDGCIVIAVSSILAARLFRLLTNEDV